MSIMKLTTFPTSWEAVEAWGKANPDLMAEFFDKATAAGGKTHGSLIGDGEFIGLNEWPSREAYDAYRRDVDEAWTTFEHDLGITIKDDFWEFKPAD